jgi:NAD-dependent dihydropyrimidine dehydrogenase PreA subunit
MYQIIINTEKCDGCEECINICPSNVLVLADGKSVAEKPEDCAGCLSCVEACPNECIVINEI